MLVYFLFRISDRSATGAGIQSGIQSGIQGYQAVLEASNGVTEEETVWLTSDLFHSDHV